jgi:hypothetical protein
MSLASSHDTIVMPARPASFFLPGCRRKNDRGEAAMTIKLYTVDSIIRVLLIE